LARTHCLCLGTVKNVAPYPRLDRERAKVVYPRARDARGRSRSSYRTRFPHDSSCSSEPDGPAIRFPARTRGGRVPPGCHPHLARRTPELAPPRPSQAPGNLGDSLRVQVEADLAVLPQHVQHGHDDRGPRCPPRRRPLASRPPRPPAPRQRASAWRVRRPPRPTLPRVARARH
jgi:hypothetical protein